MFALICVWINGWVNNREAGDLRRHRGHYDVIVMIRIILEKLDRAVLQLLKLKREWAHCSLHALHSWNVCTIFSCFTFKDPGILARHISISGSRDLDRNASKTWGVKIGATLNGILLLRSRRELITVVCQRSITNTGQKRRARRRPFYFLNRVYHTQYVHGLYGVVSGGFGQFCLNL